MRRCVIPAVVHTPAARPAVGHADHADLAGHAAHRVDRVDHMAHALIVVNPVVSQIFVDPQDVSISVETIVAYTSHEKCVCEPSTSSASIVVASVVLQTPNVLKFLQ